MSHVNDLPASDEILAFWFGHPGDSDYNRPRQAWFTKDPEFDRMIGVRFGAAIEAALAGGLEAWTETPDELLALVILLDQFPRNRYRDTAQAFAGDGRALALARLAVERGWDSLMAPVRRVFLYLPFEHSEALADQERALVLFRSLQAYPETAGFLTWAEKHHRVIARFGRFPHRNALLGRASTPEELAFLQEPGSSF